MEMVSQNLFQTISLGSGDAAMHVLLQTTSAVHTAR